MDSSVITTAVSGLAAELAPVAAVGVGIAVGVMVVKRGWILLHHLVIYPMRERRGDYD